MLSSPSIRTQGSLTAEGVDQMRIAVVGRGNIGGGLADLWERAGHEVKRIGREGGDVSEAEVVLLAVPGGAVAEALGKVEGIDGKTVIDATNLYGVVPPEDFPSNAEFVKSKTNGPTAKSFNTNEASLYSRLGDARARPSNLWCGDAEARQAVEQLTRDAGWAASHRSSVSARAGSSASSAPGTIRYSSTPCRSSTASSRAMPWSGSRRR